MRPGELVQRRVVSVGNVNTRLRLKGLNFPPCIFFSLYRYEYSSDVLLISDLSQEWRLGFLKEELQQCRDRLASEGSSMLLTAVTLIFALIGCSNRMRFKADFPVQKALGMITDLIGFMTLMLTLVHLGLECNGNVNREDATGVLQLRVTTGIGYMCYIVCLLGAFFRALFHWVRGRGSFIL